MSRTWPWPRIRIRFYSTRTFCCARHMHFCGGNNTGRRSCEASFASCVFEYGGFQFPLEGLIYQPCVPHRRPGYIFTLDFRVLQPHLHLQTRILERVACSPFADADKVKPSLLTVAPGEPPDHLHAGHKTLLSIGVSVTSWYHRSVAPPWYFSSAIISSPFCVETKR